MKPPFRLFLLVSFLSSLAHAAVVNDGSTTEGLVPLKTTSELDPTATTTLSVTPTATLEVRVSQSLTLPPIYSVWYAEAVSVTGLTHSVSVDFRPAVPEFTRVGGPVAWFNPESGRGIGFYLYGSGGGGVVELRVLDVLGGTVPGVTGLYETSGEPLTELSPAGQANLNGYQAAEFATLELAFSPPTPEDLEAVTNATARLTARVFQAAGASRVQISPDLPLLTTLPLPPDGDHRVGFYAVYADLFDFVGPIGFFDNLTVDGEFGAANLRPVVAITTPMPGAVFNAPANVSIQAQATDSDGTVTRVDFYEGTTLLGSVTSEPFSLAWTDVPIGSYELTAVAFDNRGASRTSTPVPITVQQGTAQPPVITYSRSGDSLMLSWTEPGFTLEAAADLAGTWTPIDTVGMQHTVTMAGPYRFFRLVSHSVIVQPALSFSLVGNSLVISWTQPGYVLQATQDLGTSWGLVPTTNNQHTEPMTGLRRFFRLVSQ
jgi:hypothetical protein